MDHILCKAEGGTDKAANLEAICSHCHKVKTQAEARRARERGG
ncbi:HNH endonuclease [Oceanimonas sp. NS1]|nr:HNH endonuclease [Oceanimonas sp. NS1]